MVTFLLGSREIKRTGIWRKLCCEDGIIKHHNRLIREHYQAIIHNILAVGTQNHIELLCNNFHDRYEDILQMFQEELENNEDDEEIECLILQSLSSLVYYGREGDRPHLLIGEFQKKGLTSILEIMYQKEGRVGETAKKVLEILFYNGDNY